ncbi:MAG: ATP-dependent exonuclease SbcCD, C subunit-like protein [Archangiaceae bacterium]|nr:ATP-dependent exonuclease SbcCD, C subunit-like protein [Archangiaceae bacterium]
MTPKTDLLEGIDTAERAGFRLHRLELRNWGTFNEKVWSFHAGGDTSLLTGDIGSGKSTVVDALTTLLVAPQKISYNKAAGAEARERTPRSYFLGYYKAERSDTGTGAKPVMLRTANSYSVLLAQFVNEGFGQCVTLAQVFFMRDREGQPSRLCIVADRPLTITEHFASVTEIAELRRRLRTLTKEVHDTFPPYQAAFRKRLGIQNEQALELFHQTVSMKSVGNLTDFVREHMLQPFPVEERIAGLIQHFDALTGAHEAVLKAKKQVSQLTPIVAECDQLDTETALAKADRACREALEPWFASLRVELLDAGIAEASKGLEKLAAEIQAGETEHDEMSDRRDSLKHDIARNGGDHIERLKEAIKGCGKEKADREKAATTYTAAASVAGVRVPTDASSFAETASDAASRRIEGDQRMATLRAQAIDGELQLRTFVNEQKQLAEEIQSLETRKSNIPASVMQIRDQLCHVLSIDEADLPFAGELMRVRPEEREWEGAIERVLHSFGISLLVPEEHYATVSQWVDRTHLGKRLVYHRIKGGKQPPVPVASPQSLVRKLELRHGTALADWVYDEVARHFNPICCDTIEEFRQQKEALSINGHLKRGGVRHIKDDQHRIDDRKRYVLGWTNEEKLAELKRNLEQVEGSAQRWAKTVALIQKDERQLGERLDALKRLLVFAAFEEIDWRSSERRLRDLAKQLEHAEGAASNLLRTLENSLKLLEEEMAAAATKLRKLQESHTRTDMMRIGFTKQLDAAKATVVGTSEADRALFPRLLQLQQESDRGPALSLENAETKERDLRAWLQKRIDAIDHRCTRLQQSIVKAMQDYRREWPVETKEADANVEAAGEYRRMLGSLRDDDLPRFEARFKHLLNENTIREVANFQSQLRRERQEIVERIDSINKSLREIEFNTGRFIRLDAVNASDVAVRDFQADLKACTENALHGEVTETYSEAKFLQVKKIIERFRGREGSTDVDLKWTREVTDVRNWFAFSVSERWEETDVEHEHYTDSGGKSGGQKEKLAYTVLAASLAYQFGLEWGETRSKSMRFVVIDEAFGRGSDESATYGLELFRKLNLQLLVVTPLQKIHVIEPFVANVGFVENTDGQSSRLSNLTIAQYREEKARRAG